MNLTYRKSGHVWNIRIADKHVWDVLDACNKHFNAGKAAFVDRPSAPVRKRK